MKTDLPYRVGVFSTRLEAERAAAEARRAGFKDVRILTDEQSIAWRHDPFELPGRLEDVASRGLPPPARRLPLEGAGVGLLLGFLAAWGLGAAGIVEYTFGYLVLPATGVIFFGFVGAMLTRGFTTEPTDFFDQEVAPGSVLVVIQDPDPARLARAEEILARKGVEPIPLGES
jgi:hypothetical protein